MLRLCKTQSLEINLLLFLIVKHNTQLLAKFGKKCKIFKNSIAGVICINLKLNILYYCPEALLQKTKKKMSLDRKSFSKNKNVSKNNLRV